MFAGCLQIMWAHSHLIRAGGVGYSQIIRAENADVCRSYGLCLQAATATNRLQNSKETVKCFSCLFRYLTAKNSCGVTRSICSPMRESKQAAQPHQFTEGFSWKWEWVQGLAPVGLHSMTAGIPMWAYGRLPWVQINCRLNPVPIGLSYLRV